MRITLWSIDAEGTSQEVALVGNTSDESWFDGMAGGTTGCISVRLMETCTLSGPDDSAPAELGVVP